MANRAGTGSCLNHRLHRSSALGRCCGSQAARGKDEDCKQRQHCDIERPPSDPLDSEALIPIMIGTGTGSEVMQRIAAPMVGGMMTAPLLSMLSCRPCTYSCVVALRVQLNGSQRQYRTAAIIHDDMQEAFFKMQQNADEEH